MRSNFRNDTNNTRTDKKIEKKKKKTKKREEKNRRNDRQREAHILKQFNQIVVQNLYHENILIRLDSTVLWSYRVNYKTTLLDN